MLRNPHTRAAYERAIRQFLEYCEKLGRELRTIAPRDVGTYLDRLAYAPATKKLHLSALRHFFDTLVTRHAIAFNPALSVRGERLQVVEGKTREIPVRHDLQQFINRYLSAGGLSDSDKSTPIFRTTIRRTRKLTTNGMTSGDMGRMVKRRLRQAELPLRLSPHSFRVTTITDLLSQGVPLEDVQMLAGHADPRTTRLYDRRHRQVTRNIVERISV
jgi:site-specific recombinase XerD